MTPPAPPHLPAALIATWPSLRLHHHSRINLWFIIHHLLCSRRPSQLDAAARVFSTFLFGRFMWGRWDAEPQMSLSSGGTLRTLPISSRAPATSWELGLYVPSDWRFFRAVMMSTNTTRMARSTHRVVRGMVTTSQGTRSSCSLFWEEIWSSKNSVTEQRWSLYSLDRGFVVHTNAHIFHVFGVFLFGVNRNINQKN